MPTNRGTTNRRTGKTTPRRKGRTHWGAKGRSTRSKTAGKAGKSAAAAPAKK